MERGFQSLLLTGKYSVGDDDFSPVSNSDEVYTNRELNFQSLSYDKSLISSLHYPYGSSHDQIIAGSIHNKKIDEISKEYGKWRSVKKLKNEPATEQLNFPPAIMFSQLPELRSMEKVYQEENRLKQKFSPKLPTTSNHILEPMVTSFQLTANYFAPAPVLQPLLPPLPPPAKMSSRDYARKKRNTLSDKTRSLQKVLPWDKKMDMATIYEETFKYINFLKAQISVLESMPIASPSSSNFGSGNPRFCNLYGGLGKLNRQQLLEVLVNSPAAQSILYSKGCCIYSIEQLILFKDIAEKRFFISGSSIF